MRNWVHDGTLLDEFLIRYMQWSHKEYTRGALSRYSSLVVAYHMFTELVGNRDIQMSVGKPDVPPLFAASDCPRREGPSRQGAKHSYVRASHKWHDHFERESDPSGLYIVRHETTQPRNHPRNPGGSVPQLGTASS